MDAATVLEFIQVGAVGVMLMLFVLGIVYPKSVVTDLKTECAELKQALQAERDRADAAVAAAQTSRDLLAALRAGIELSKAPAREEMPS